VKFCATDIRDGLEWPVSFDAVCWCAAEQFCDDHDFILLGRLVSEHDSKTDEVAEAMVEAQESTKQ